MTPKEALNWLISNKTWLNTNKVPEVVYEAIEQALNELEVLKKRNEPKKVVFNVKDTVYVGCADCPTCGATIDRDDESGLINFCQYCGQALDWGEVK